MMFGIVSSDELGASIQYLNEIEFNFEIRATTTVELCLDHYRAISARKERKN